MPESLPLSAALAFALAFLMLLVLLKTRFAGVALDRPNERSLHAAPVPRTGGLAIMAGILAAWALVWQPWLLVPACCVLFLVVLSFLDDIHNLSAGWRFAAHFLAGVVFLGFGDVGAIGAWLWLALLVATVWMTNLYNFMDGSDGLAGGMALFGFSFYAVAAWLAADVGLAAAALAIAAASAAFLLFNFHPARIFMGDAGSIPLGFLAAALGLLGWQRGDWPWWFPALVFSPFVVDATVTLLKRLLRGEKVWQAHRSHYYQRLVQMGWGHRATALAEYGMMFFCGGYALWLSRQDSSAQWIGVAVCGMIYCLLAVAIDRRWRQQ